MHRVISGFCLCVSLSSFLAAAAAAVAAAVIRVYVQVRDNPRRLDPRFE